MLFNSHLHDARQEVSVNIHTGQGNHVDKIHPQNDLNDIKNSLTSHLGRTHTSMIDINARTS